MCIFLHFPGDADAVGHVHILRTTPLGQHFFTLAARRNQQENIDNSHWLASTSCAPGYGLGSSLAMEIIKALQLISFCNKDENLCFRALLSSSLASQVAQW